MPRFRGAGDVERLAVDFTTVTATGAVLAFPAVVYAINAILSASTTSGMISLADTTAAADVGLESVRWDFKFGSAAASSNSEWHYPRMFTPPIAIQRQLFAAVSTGIQSVSVSYYAIQ